MLLSLALVARKRSLGCRSAFPHTHFRIATLIHILRCIALACLAACLCALPGSNAKLPWSTHQLIEYLAALGFIFWFVARILAWKAPRPHERAVWLIALLVGACGWLLTWFPSAMVERATGAILELDKNPWTAFGTIDQATSVQAMISMSAALMVLLMTLDIASERGGRYVLALAVTVIGFVTAVAGLCLHTSADLISLWNVPHVPDSVFGLFWYHGNTAAFLNLAWPAGIWLSATLLNNEPRSFRQQLVLAGLMAAVMVQVIAVFVNVSKMGHLMLVLEMLLMVGAALVLWKPRLGDLPLSGRRLLLLLFIGVGVLVLGAWLSGAGDGMGRWNVFAAHRFDDPARRHAAVMAFQIGVDYGWTGTGPGTFEWVSAHYSTLDPVLQSGHWRHAHNDYAEFFAEWGWLGAALFVLLLTFPGRRLVGALRQVFSKNSRFEMSFQRRAGLICFSTALFSALLHAVVDFPLQVDAIRYLCAVLAGLALAMAVSSARHVSRRRAVRDMNQR